MEVQLKKTLVTAAVVFMMTSSFALAQSSQGKGGAPTTGETADPAKGMGKDTASGGSSGKTMSKKKMKKSTGMM